MTFAIALLLFLALLYGPMVWVRVAMHRHGKSIDAMPGTGSELATHLLERFQLEGVTVEETTEGNDHYSPTDKAVRLSPKHFHGKSITAIAVAAHEVGHAIQFGRQEPIAKLRNRWIPTAITLRKSGILLLTGVPILAAIVKVPTFIVMAVTCGLVLQLLGALMYLIVLPEEWDASFNKALPILREGYIPKHHEPAVEEVLRAAALTYFASALADLLNVARWAMVLRR